MKSVHFLLKIFGVMMVFVAVMAPQARAQSSSNQNWIEKPVAVLQALDKVTARVSRIQIPVGKTYKFGQIAITIETCRVRPPTMTPESVAFLEINEYQNGQKAQQVFSGWMFASSPALSALEHPVYDVWVLSCAEGVTAEQE